VRIHWPTQNRETTDRAPGIGEPRIYEGGVIPIIYPGESASPRGFTGPELLVAFREALARGEAQVSLSASGWLVGPSPGVYAAFLRWRYRLIGRFSRATPKLTVTVTATATEPRDGGT